MRESWATSGSDLHLELAGQRSKTGLEQALRAAVRREQLTAGARLPSSRQLAEDLGLARNTVAEAYGQLIAEGWLTARHGAGTWVAERTPVSVTAEPPARTAHSTVDYDLSPGVPDLSLFPRAAWLAAARKALSAAPNDLLGYGDPRGVEALRVALAEYLGRVRGVVTTPERIFVSAGFAQGLDAVCQVLRDRSTQTLTTEAYGLPLHRSIISARGLQIATTDVDADGADVDSLGDAALLTPAHQFPTGVSLDPGRRRRAVERGTLVIEDDYDGEFRYNRAAVGAMQALAPERVVYAGTASKSLAPGLRLAWLALPGHLVDDVVEAARLGGRLPGAIEQLTLAEFIASGSYDRHIRRVRLIYRRRRDQLVELVGARDLRITGIAAGLHALLEVPDEERIVHRAAAQGLRLRGLRNYAAPGRTGRPAIVVGYARPPQHRLAETFARLRAALP
jgi:GntR family transcriptional regulator/MocR family aminotransferase